MDFKNKIKIIIMTALLIGTSLFIILAIGLTKKISPEKQIVQFIANDIYKFNDTKEIEKYSNSCVVTRVRSNSKITMYKVFSDKLFGITEADYYNYYKDNGNVAVLESERLWRDVSEFYKIDLNYCHSSSVDLNEFNNFFKDMNLPNDSLIECFCSLLSIDLSSDDYIRINSSDDLTNLLLKHSTTTQKDSLFLKNNNQKIHDFTFLNRTENGVYYYFYRTYGLVKFVFFINSGKIERVNSTLIGKTPWIDVLM